MTRPFHFAKSGRAYQKNTNLVGMDIALHLRTIPIHYALRDRGQKKERKRGDTNMANAPNKNQSVNDQKDLDVSRSASSVTDAADRFNTGSKSSGTGGTATARGFYDQAKETAGQAYEVVSEKAVTKIDEQKSTLSDGLSTVADSIRQVGDNLGSAKTDSGLAESAAKYTQTAAQRIEDIAGYFETKSVRDMARDLESFARRNPVVFLGAAFGLGFLAARFLKSAAPGQFEEGTSTREGFRAEGTDRSLRSDSKSQSGTSNLESTATESF